MGTQQRLLLVFCAVLICGAAFFISDSKEVLEAVPVGETHAVVLHSEGFSPEYLTVKKGDVVVFSTTREYAYWPASDHHPTHNLYRDFDPKGPVQSDAEWSFQFTEPGEWHFHDHLNSTYTGLITVTP